MHDDADAPASPEALLSQAVHQTPVDNIRLVWIIQGDFVKRYALNAEIIVCV